MDDKKNMVIEEVPKDTIMLFEKLCSQYEKNGKLRPSQVFAIMVDQKARRVFGANTTLSEENQNDRKTHLSEPCSD